MSAELREVPPALRKLVEQWRDAAYQIRTEHGGPEGYWQPPLGPRERAKTLDRCATELEHVLEVRPGER